MSSRKYNTNDNDLIWESFQNRTNHKISKQNSRYSELLENDLKYIEEFLIREGIWDKVKGAAGAAAGKVKDFAADKIMKPLMDMLAAAIQKDPASAEKLPELQQAAQGGGDIGAILQASGDQSIMKQIEGQPDAAAGGVADPADPEAAAAPQAESYLYQFNMNKMICETLVDQGIISESKSQIIQERRKFEAANVLFESLKKNTQPKDCPWMPNLVIEKDVRGADGRFAAGNQSGVQYAPADAPTAEAPAAAPAAGGGYTGSVRKDVSVLKSNIKQFLKANPKMATDGRFKSIEQMVSGLDREGRTAETPAEAPAEAPATGTPEAPAEAPATSTPEAPATSTPEVPATSTPEAPAAKPEGTPGPAAPTVGAGGASMPAEKPVADGATPAGGAPTPADGAAKPGILGKIWNFVKENKGTIGGLAAMGIAAALTLYAGPAVAAMATKYLTGGLIAGAAGAIKGAKGTEGGFTDKLKGAAAGAGKASMKGGALSTVAGMAGNAVGNVMGDAEATAAAGEVPSAAAEPYVEPSVAPEVPEDLPTSSINTPWDPDSQGGEMSDEDWANLPSQGGTNYDLETGAAMPTDANGETPGVDYQEPDAKSAAEAEAGVGQIDPVTGKKIEMIDPENKPGFFKKLGSFLPGGTTPREVWGSNTGKG